VPPQAGLEHHGDRERQAAAEALRLKHARQAAGAARQDGCARDGAQQLCACVCDREGGKRSEGRALCVLVCVCVQQELLQLAPACMQGGWQQSALNLQTLTWCSAMSATANTPRLGPLALLCPARMSTSESSHQTPAPRSHASSGGSTPLVAAAAPPLLLPAAGAAALAELAPVAGGMLPTQLLRKHQ
jgi:hypothetical protein